MSVRRLERAVAGGLAGWAVARVAGADRVAMTQAWTAPLLAFTPTAAAGAWAGALLLRGSAARTVATVAATALTAVVLPRAVPRRQPDAGGPVLRVITVNLLVGQGEADALVALARARAADVLFVQELTDKAADRLRRAGIGELFASQMAERAAHSPHDTGIFARYPLRSVRQSGETKRHADGEANGRAAGGAEGRTHGEANGRAGAAQEANGRAGADQEANGRAGAGRETDGRAGVTQEAAGQEADDLPGADGLRSVPQRTARLDLPSGQSVHLVCVHIPPPKPPWSPGSAARWREELGKLPAPGRLPLIMAGDFNATLDHAPFRRVLRRGYRDAASQVGNGLVPTWGPEPYGQPPLLTIDHVLVDPSCEVLTTSVHRLTGTDHRALYAEVRLPR